MCGFSHFSTHFTVLITFPATFCLYLLFIEPRSNKRANIFNISATLAAFFTKLNHWNALCHDTLRMEINTFRVPCWYALKGTGTNTVMSPLCPRHDLAKRLPPQKIASMSVKELSHQSAIESHSFFKFIMLCKGLWCIGSLSVFPQIQGNAQFVRARAEKPTFSLHPAGYTRSLRATFTA